MSEATSIFDILIWAGVAISVVGLIGLLFSILQVMKARRTAKSDEELRAAVQKALPLNLGALFLSVIGLMLVIVGVFLNP